MRQSKASKPRGSKKGSELHHEPVVEAVVLEPYTVIIHDPELKKAIEDRKAEEERKMAEEEPVQLVVEPEVEILIGDLAPEAEPVVSSEPVVDEYVAKYSEDGQKVYNPSSKRYVKCDSVLAKRLNLIR
jgi:hypothetical protein